MTRNGALASATTRSMADRLGPVRSDRDALFTYGTLMFPDVLTALLDRLPAQQPVSTRGWRAAALTGRVYPGLVAATGGTAEGQLVHDLSGEEWRLLDHFEDNTYELRPVALDDGRAGWAYVWPAEYDVDEQMWDARQFVRDHLSVYAARCQGWRCEYLAAHPPQAMRAVPDESRQAEEGSSRWVAGWRGGHRDPGFQIAEPGDQHRRP